MALAELERIDGAKRVFAALTDARLLTVSDGEVEVSHEALLREWPRYRAWLEEDRVGRRLHAHLMSSAREWDARGRDAGELYRGARLAGALDWTAQHRDQLNALEREFIQSSRLEAERAARRLRSVLVGVGVLLAVSVVAGIIALAQRSTATTKARVALARQLGAQAVNEPRTDLAMLLAREAVRLDRSSQTEGTLLATLLRSPAIAGTFALPINAPPQRLALSPDGRTLAVGDNAGDVRFYDPRTHAARQPPLTDFSGGLPPVYTSDGSLLVYPVQGEFWNDTDTVPFIAVRDAHTLALLRRLAFDPFLLAQQTLDIPNASVLIAPNRRTVYCAYSVLDAAGNPAAAHLDRWSLPSGRRLSTAQIGSGALFAARLIDAGNRLIVVRARGVSVFDTRSLRRLRSVEITPTGNPPTAAGISPDGRTIVIGSQTGRVSFIDLATGNARAGVG